MSDKRRDKGDGTVYETVINGYPYWVAKYKPPRMTKPIIKYAKTEAEAKRKLKQIKQNAAMSDPSSVQKLSVQQYMENWLNAVKKLTLKDRSFDTLESTLINSVFPYIGDYQIASITPDEVQAMITALTEKGLSYSTAKKAYNAVNDCFKRGIIKGDIIKNPCIGVVLPSAKRKKVSDIRFLNDVEIEAVAKASTLKYNNGNLIYRLGYAVIFLMYTGLRIGEFRALKWSDVDFAKKEAKIFTSVVRAKNRDAASNKKYLLHFQDSVKTEAGERVIPLSKTAIDALCELKKINGEYEYIACTNKGKIIHERAFDRMLRAICDRSGIDPCGAHVLRHTFASLLFRKGVNVKTVSKLLGHSDTAITYNTYIHLIKEQEREAVDLLDVL